MINKYVTEYNSYLVVDIEEDHPWDKEEPLNKHKSMNIKRVLLDLPTHVKKWIIWIVTRWHRKEWLHVCRWIR